VNEGEPLLSIPSRKSCTESPSGMTDSALVTVAYNYVCVYMCVTRVSRLLRGVPHAEYRDRLSRTCATRAAAAPGLWTGWHQSTRSVLYLRISHSRGRVRSLARTARHVDSVHGQFHHGREDWSFFPSFPDTRTRQGPCVVHCPCEGTLLCECSRRKVEREVEGRVRALGPVGVCMPTGLRSIPSFSRRYRKCGKRRHRGALSPLMTA